MSSAQTPRVPMTLRSSDMLPGITAKAMSQWVPPVKFENSPENNDLLNNARSIMQMPIRNPTDLDTKENLNRELYEQYPRNFFKNINVNPTEVYGLNRLRR